MKISYDSENDMKRKIIEFSTKKTVHIDFCFIMFEAMRLFVAMSISLGRTTKSRAARRDRKHEVPRTEISFPVCPVSSHEYTHIFDGRRVFLAGLQRLPKR